LATQTVAPPSTEILTQKSDKILYTLWYRQGSNPHPQFIFFPFPSRDIRTIVDRAKRHCEVMNYRFVSVKATIVDLDHAENFLLNKEG
jgi:hypothetical protein